MSAFPIFIDIHGQSILVVGAGQVASRKVEKLLPFGPRLSVVAPRGSGEMESWARDARVDWARRSFAEEDLDGKALVIVAVDDIPLQARIFEICRERRIPCNCVDSPAYCSFFFPALVTKGRLTVGISTGGSSPAVSARLRELIEGVIPEGIDGIIEAVSEFRRSPRIKGLAAFSDRAKEVNRFVDHLFAAKRPPKKPPAGTS